MDQNRPFVFIGSSREALAVAEAIQAGLQHDAESMIWNQGLFRPGASTLETLVDESPKFDFAVLVLHADDLVTARGEEKLAPRDNVMLELGLFMGTLGRDRTVFVFSRDRTPKLPSDLAGVTALTYSEPRMGTLEAALGPACAEIKKTMRRLGLRQDKRLARLDSAARGIEGVNDSVERMIRLLVKSRKVELDIITKQFGALIDRGSFAEILADLDTFEATLRAQSRAVESE